MPDHTLDQQERLRTRLKWFLFCRVIVVSFFLGALALIYLESAAQSYAVSVELVLFAITATYAFTIVSAVLLQRLQRLSAFAYLQLLFDVGLTTGACLAYLGHKVTCVDPDAHKIGALQRGFAFRKISGRRVRASSDEQ